MYSVETVKAGAIQCSPGKGDIWSL